MLSLYLSALLLGLGAAPGCMGVCLPLMAPLITSRSNVGVKEGVRVSLYLSGGRLLIYLPLSASAGYIGGEYIWGFNQRLALTLLGALMLIYALLSLKGWGEKLCSVRFLRSRRGGFAPLLFGVALGAIVCPAFLLAIGDASLTGSPVSGILIGILFWLGTLPAYLLLGAAVGEGGRRWRGKWEEERVRRVSLITLMLIGSWWILSALVG